uniref:Uncharacterized protein n=1 Tax=Anguilla anguilla TaxID=7936 RepID=A0A0E9SRD2_ANGAN
MSCVCCRISSLTYDCIQCTSGHMLRATKFLLVDDINHASSMLRMRN